MATDETTAKHEADLFREIVGDVRPVAQDRAEPHHARPRPSPQFTRAAEARVMHDALHEPFDPDQHETGEELLYCSPGLQHSAFRRLRRGQFVVEAELDLHGMTSPEARRAVGDFLTRSRRFGWRCVRVVHGKGLGSRHRGPVLKKRIGGWLRQREEVLGFASARPVDGGTGAVYVLLKRG
jgi:DNA-nicking Smr family endonuclease